MNVRCLEGVDIAGLHPSLFDGQHWEEFMAAHRAAGEASSFQGVKDADTVIARGASSKCACDGDCRVAPLLAMTVD